MRSNEKPCVCNVFATPHSKNPVKSSIPSYKNVNFSSVRDNYSITRISEKPDITRVTEVVESCQMCWISNGMQHICNKYATRISMICIGHFQRNLGMSFLLRLNLVNCIYKLLNIKVGIYFLGQSHCTGMSHNLLDNRLVYTSFC